MNTDINSNGNTDNRIISEPGKIYNKGDKVEGIITLTSKLEGYVRVPEHPEMLSIFVEANNIDIALHGDTVLVEIVGKREDPKTKSDQYIGVVESIIKRGKYAYAGLVQKEVTTSNNGKANQKSEVYFFVPQDKKVYVDFIIPEENLAGAVDGDKVAVEIVSWSGPKTMPIAKVVQILGKPGNNDAEMLAYAIEKGFNSEHDEKVIAESEEISRRGIKEEDMSGRRDFRGVTTFTIDPIDAKDFDDAISYKVLENGHIEIGVHIADVSFYVKEGSALDGEAVERQTSVYLVDRCLPMLPEVLSNDLCSLVEGKDRLTMAAVFEVDADCNVHNVWYGRTVINSNRRFTYEDAQDIMDNGTGLYYDELANLNRLAKILTKKRFEMGALSLDSEEVKFKMDENGFPIDVYIKERRDVHKMIEEWMLMANRYVSEYITKASDKSICIYRIHDKPDADKMHELYIFLRSLNLKVRIIDGLIPTEDLNRILAELEGLPVKDLVQVKITRTMQKAIYSTKNTGHYGLAFEYYSHFTSPIRRYPDVMTHRLLQRTLNKDIPDPKERGYFDRMCLRASMREKEASDAERGSIKYKQVQYMSVRLGQVLDGTVSGVGDFGIYVEEKTSKCEGMIRLKNLGNDFYIYDAKSMIVKGEKTGKEFKIGDRIQIEVMSADLDLRQIDYKLKN